MVYKKIISNTLKILLSIQTQGGWTTMPLMKILSKKLVHYINQLLTNVKYTNVRLENCGAQTQYYYLVVH